jgi:hypothetical protein
VRRFVIPVAVLGVLATAVSIGSVRAVGAVPGTAAAPSVRTLVGPGALNTPGGIALDAAGDLFVADTGHCRVLVVPARSGTAYGRRLQAGRAATVAGGSCRGRSHGAIGYPTGVAVDVHGDLYVAETTMQRVQIVHRTGGPPVTIVGTGRAGFNGDGLSPAVSQLDRPTGVAVDGAGDLFIADTANCRVRVLPAENTTLFGQTMSAGHLYTAAGTGVCGTAGQGGPVTAAQLWNPVALAVDRSGDLLVADSGDQSVLLAAAVGGTYYGTTVGAGDIGVVVGGSGSYGPYVFDGLPATGPWAELNDPRGLAVGPTGALFVTDGFMHVLRVVPASTGPLLGQNVAGGDVYTVAGALPVATAEGLGDGTRWVLTHMDTPIGVAASPAGSVYYSDGGLNVLRVIEAR